MFRVVHNPTPYPISYPVHPSAEFQPGYIAQITVIGNDAVMTVSDGTAPIGIIDDSKTSSFSRVQIDEIVEIVVKPEDIVGGLTTRDYDGYLEYPYVLDNSFTSTKTIILNATNGIVTIPEGTAVETFVVDGVTVQGFKMICNYAYKIANQPGADTTLGSNMVTVHYTRGWYETDQFDSTALYPLNATLYVGLDGKLTTKQVTSRHPGVAVVTGPPSSLNSTLQFMWL